MEDLIMSHTVIDVHCHFFNAKYAFAELLEIAWRSSHDEYPYKGNERQLTASEQGSTSYDLKGLVNYVASLLGVAVKSPEKNYDDEQSAYSASEWHPSTPLMTVPLMMDIFFVGDDGSKSVAPAANGSTGAQRSMSITPEVSSSFEALAHRLKEEVLLAYQGALRSRERGVTPVKRSRTVERELDLVIKTMSKASSLQTRDVMDLKGGQVQMTPGFYQHMKDLRALQKKRAESVFPFLAVDPRRTGIEMLVQEQVIAGPFKGIKLYPPLGYLPTHPALYPIYKLCMQHDVPVTVHTSPYGFNTLCKRVQVLSKKRDGSTETITVELSQYPSAAAYFANPNNWLEILENEKFNKLRLNFAHFGGDADIRHSAESPGTPGNWTEQIIQLMNRFENVYADCAFCPDSDTMNWIKEIAAREPIVKQRLMFGTDFIMVMLKYEQDGLQTYFNNYLQAESAMVEGNARHFLKMA